ncbi:MAG: hypothetical protein ACRD44_00455 [Bryobacteraceae bacterium]
MANINNRVYALSAVTPMKWWKTPILRVLFSFLSLFPQILRDLRRLSFIHFARWVIVSRRKFPHLDSAQPAENLKYDYLLFFSNFNGTWNQYIDAFSSTIAPGLDGIWRWSEKYPLAVPVTPFKDYITSVQFETDYHYSAYPGATANDVKAAIAVHDAYEELASSSPLMTPEQFGQAWGQFVQRVQCNLGQTGGPGPAGT